MSKSWKRFLSLLLALTMILSLGVTGFAEDTAEDETPIMEPGTPAEEPAPDDGNLEIIDISPDKLNIPKLGLEETEDEELPDGEELTPMEEDLDEVVRVSIFLETPSAMEAGYAAETAGTNAGAIAYRDGLRAQQAELTAQIESVIGHELNVHWNITLALNAISADLSLAEIVKVQALPGVKAVERENQYLPMDDETAEPNTANTSENMVGATAAWAAGYTGAGSRIAIIDTGIDPTHQSFAAEPFEYAIQQAGAANDLMTQADINRVLSQLNAKKSMSSVTAAQLNQNGSKIVYGFNYVDGSLTIDHVHDTEGEHGSHVAGIAAANRFIGSAHDDAASTVGAVGMAPDAQLLIMKVFGANGGAYDSDYMVAIEDAMILGCDVANLSLGSGVQGWTFSSNSYQGLVNGWANADNNAKMVLSISAGNAYDLAYMTKQRNLYADDVSMHTGGSPGSFVNSLCVAAAQNTLTTGTPMEFNGSQDVFYYESTGNEEEGTTYTNPALTTIVGTYNYVYIDAVGSAADYSAINSAVGLSGKVVLVNRGEISFVEKGENVKSYNPKALIIANNQPGTIFMDLTDFTGTFPMVTITQKDAEQIKAGAASHTASGITYYTGSMKVTNTEKEVLIDRSAATITDFSSWGVPGSLLMKPEITAPGGDIYSVAGTNNTNSGTAGGSDQYESMSGTSMAAPHITGLTAVLAEYQRENELTALCPDLTGYSLRAIAQSLMMSTATPMAPGGEYLPILQQGAGLADVSKAITANSIIMMDTANSGLTGKTGAAADGKVKVELGDDPLRKGDYSFGFTVYNLSDDDLHFNVRTDMFTQGVALNADGELIMTRETVGLDATGTCWWEDLDGNVPAEGHDVNKDGVTDERDAQAILDYLSGEIEDESELDLEAGEMDGDDFLSTQDAYLLLGFEPAEGEGLGSGVVPAHGKRYCAVRITLSDADKEDLDLYYAGGAYLQGFTYVTCDSTTEEGAVYADEHSIPILGFYGSWTDATMFDTAPYTEKLYGSKQENYTGNAATNYLTLQMNGANVKFSGNPYMVENEFPADRLAINSNTTIGNIAYNLIRAAGTTGFAVSKLDADHQVTDVLSAAVTGNEAEGLWYDQSSGSWQNVTQKLYSVNKAPGAYGLAEGDLFRVGFYAIPEYNAMLVNDSYNAADSGMLDQKGFETLLKSNVLGTGAFVGFDFLVDNTAPVVESASLNGSEITVTASDDQALAYVAILSLDGETVYSEYAPGEAKYTTTLDASDAIANANGYVAVFAGDYAGNEAAVAVKVNDNGYAPMTVYVLTDTLTAGEEYLIVSGNTAGTRYALNYTLNTSGTTATVGRNAVTVKAGTDKTNNKVYIEDTDVSSTAVWTVGVGSSNTYRTFSNNDWYLRSSNRNNLTITKDDSRRDWTWDGSNNRLSNNSRYLRYYNNTFSLNTATSSVYLYQKTTIPSDQPIDPYTVTNVTVTPATLDLYKGNTADVTAKVLPLTASDRTVTWSSSNNAIAKVDEFGRVTAVAAGTAAIRATSNADSSKYGECTVTVNSFNKALNGIVWDEEGNVFFSSFNSNSMPTWNPLHSNPVGTYLTNAFMFDASTLYASTCDLSDTSVLYTVNRSTYALTEFGNNYVPAFGLARGMTGFASYGLDFMVYGFAKYLIMGNVTPDHEDPNDSSSALYSGLPYALLDLSTTAVGDAYVCAVCARTISGQSASYYFLDETGKIWQISMNYDSSVGEDESPFVFSSPTLVVDTGIGTSFQYQSLYYDGTRIYWTHTTDEDCQLIIYVPSTGKLYNAGNFGDDVWPVAGVYVDGKAAPNAVGDEPMDDAFVGEPTLLQPIATRYALLTEDVIARLSAEGFSFGWALDEELEDEEIPEEEDLFEEPVEEPVEEPAHAEEGEASVFLGGLNAVRQILRLPVTLVSDLGAAGESEEDPKAKTLVIDLSETEDSHNGLIAVDYDPKLLTLVSAESTDAASHISIHNYKDTEKGVVTIAYANKSDGSGDDTLPINSRAAFDPADDIEAGTVIVTLVFETSCVPAEVNLTTLERNDELELNEQETIEAEGANHAWGEPTWTWAEDYSSATASFVCANDETHTKSLTAAVTSETTEASCEEAGKTVYTATVELDGETYTDTKEVAIEAIGHAWGEPTWEWAEDYSSATATFVCENDASHTKTVNATITSETNGRETVYTATVELDGLTYTDTKTVVSTAVTVSFDAGEGTVEPATKEVNPGEAIGELPVPTREGGWKFIGWFTAPAESYLTAGQGTQVTAETTVDEDTTVYAHWRLPGDINGDGKVNNKDVTRLQKYLKGEAVEVVAFNLDTNGDGNVSNKDLTRLQRFVKGETVELN